jgi:hypothetical protein
LPHLSRSELLKLWCDSYGSDPPEKISDLLMRQDIAHRLQVKHLGGLNFSTRRALKGLLEESGAIRFRPHSPSKRVTNGTVLVREWHGVTHQVTATEQGVLFVPVGYVKRDRRLVIDEAEAETVRLIFRRYNELKSVRLLKQDLDRRGLVSRIRTGKNGLELGGKAYSRGKLYKLLSNPIYKGEIRHLKICHPGQHQPVIDSELWDKTQQLLTKHAVRRAGGTAEPAASPLAGRLFDENGQTLTPTHSVKKGRRHRYYVSRLLLTAGPSATAGNGWRLPAKEIEPSIAAAAVNLLEDKSALVTAIQERGIEAHRIVPILEQAAAWVRKLRSSAQGEALVRWSIE